jgi:hypothetical protein
LHHGTATGVPDKNCDFISKYLTPWESVATKTSESVFPRDGPWLLTLLIQSLGNDDQKLRIMSICSKYETYD